MGDIDLEDMNKQNTHELPVIPAEGLEDKKTELLKPKTRVDGNRQKKDIKTRAGYAGYNGRTEILRRSPSDNEEPKRSGRGRRRHSKEYQEGYFAMETVSLVALAVVVIVFVVAAIMHVEMAQFSLPVLGITVVLMVLMGIFLGGAPSFVTLLLVAMSLIAGMVTGTMSEVISGVVVFLGTVLCMKDRG